MPRPKLHQELNQRTASPTPHVLLRSGAVARLSRRRVTPRPGALGPSGNASRARRVHAWSSEGSVSAGARGAISGGRAETSPRRRISLERLRRGPVQRCAGRRRHVPKAALSVSIGPAMARGARRLSAQEAFSRGRIFETVTLILILLVGRRV